MLEFEIYENIFMRYCIKLFNTIYLLQKFITVNLNYYSAKL